MMHPNYIIGFHGCEKEVAKKVLLGEADLKMSSNKYDWLGEGIYFWENDYNRALEFAQEFDKKEPFVLGAIINLGNCLDLTLKENIYLLKYTYDEVIKDKVKNCSNIEGKRGGINGDLMLRNLDCAVINSLHEINKKLGIIEYNSVRAAFWEGEELYKSAGFREKNHIQICVRNSQCIIGYFLPQNLRQQNL